MHISGIWQHYHKGAQCYRVGPPGDREVLRFAEDTGKEPIDRYGEELPPPTPAVNPSAISLNGNIAQSE